eukprot:331999_1
MSFDVAAKMKLLKNDTGRLKKWILEYGQPAIEQVDELKMVVKEYETERTDSQFDVQRFNHRLSTLETLENELKQTRTRSALLYQEHASLMLHFEESENRYSTQKKEIYSLQKKTHIKAKLY